MGKNFLAITLGFILLCQPGWAAAPGVTLRFAGQFPEGHSSTRLMREVVDEVKEKSAGRISIEVFPDNELGDYTLVYEELIRGSVDMAAITVPSQFDPRFEISYMNGAVRTFDGARRLFADNGWLFNKMDELHTRLGVKLLAFQMEGFIGIGSVKPVREPLEPGVKKGILLRIPKMEAFKLSAEAMGYQTITIPWDEVRPSLQNGYAEGVSGMTPAAANTMLEGVLKYWYDFRFAMENLNYMISLKTWEKLSEEDREIIAEACSKITSMSIDLAERDQQRHLNLMKEAGVEVHTYEREELTALFSAIRATWDHLAPNLTWELIADFAGEFGER